jgi:hypothetical protein
LFSTQEIHKILVVPLPIGSRLVTVLDTCHSGSLLGTPVSRCLSSPLLIVLHVDLKHYRCNRVWIPWLYKGTRSSEAYHSMIGPCSSSSGCKSKPSFSSAQCFS